MSERMACRLAGLSRSAYRRPLKGDTAADPDRALRDWLRAYAKKHPWWGYRRAYHDARGEGWVVNHKKIQRLWRDEDLRVPQRRRRKRIGSSTVDAPTADAPNVVWAVDFQFDADEQGRPIKICSIVDEHTRDGILSSSDPVCTCSVLRPTHRVGSRRWRRVRSPRAWWSKSTSPRRPSVRPSGGREARGAARSASRRRRGRHPGAPR